MKNFLWITPLFLGTLISCSLFQPPTVPYTSAEVSAPAFDAASFWYQPLSGKVAHADSPSMIEAMVNEHLRDSGSETLYKLLVITEGGSVPLYYSDSSTSRSTVPITNRGYGATAIIDVPIPDWLQPDSASDGHVAIVDSSAGIEYDFWQMRIRNGRWVASSAAVLPLSGNGVHQNKFSVTASGFALGAGLIWPEEILAGSIDHALVFGYPFTRLNSYVSPATRSDGRNDNPAAMPMGALVTFPDSFDPATDPNPALNSFELMIAQAIKTYGMYLYDTGSPGSIVELDAVNPRSFSDDPYTDVPRYNSDDGYIDVGNIPIDQLIVVDYGEVFIWGDDYPQDITYEEMYLGVE